MRFFKSLHRSALVGLFLLLSAPASAFFFFCPFCNFPFLFGAPYYYGYPAYYAPYYYTPYYGAYSAPAYRYVPYSYSAVPIFHRGFRGVVTPGMVHQDFQHRMNRYFMAPHHATIDK